METFFKYAHEVVMFLAVAVSLGGTTLLFRLAKAEEVSAIRAAFALLRPTVNGIAPLYILGTVLGLVTGWVMGLPLLAFWLVAAYVLTAVAAGLGEVTKRWFLRVATLAEAETGATPSPELRAALQSRGVRVIRMVDMGFLLVFLGLMVFRPNLW